MSSPIIPESGEAAGLPDFSDVTSTGRPHPRAKKGLGNAAGRIVAGALDDFAVGGAEVVLNARKTAGNLYKKYIDPNFRDEDMERIEAQGGIDKVVDEFVPFDEFSDNHFGGRPEGWQGYAEAFGKEAVKFVAMGGLLRGAGMVVNAPKLMRGAKLKDVLLHHGKDALEMAKVGYVTDFLFSNPEENLANLLSQTPPEKRNVIQRAFMADPDDSEWEKRLKNANVGFLVGSVLDVGVGALKALRFGIKAKGLPVGTPERAAAEQSAKDALAQASDAAARADSPVAVEKAADGFVVKVDGQPVLKTADSDAANAAAKSLTDLTEKADVAELAGPVKAQAKQALDALAEGGSAEVAAQKAAAAGDYSPKTFNRMFKDAARRYDERTGIVKPAEASGKGRPKVHTLDALEDEYVQLNAIIHESVTAQGQTKGLVTQPAKLMKEMQELKAAGKLESAVKVLRAQRANWITKKAQYVFENGGTDGKVIESLPLRDQFEIEDRVAAMRMKAANPDAPDLIESLFGLKPGTKAHAEKVAELEAHKAAKEQARAGRIAARPRPLQELRAGKPAAQLNAVEFTERGGGKAAQYWDQVDGTVRADLTAKHSKQELDAAVLELEQLADEGILSRSKLYDEDRLGEWSAPPLVHILNDDMDALLREYGPVAEAPIDAALRESPEDVAEVLADAIDVPHKVLMDDEAMRDIGAEVLSAFSKELGGESIPDADVAKIITAMDDDLSYADFLRFVNNDQLPARLLHLAQVWSQVRINALTKQAAQLSDLLDRGPNTATAEQLRDVLTKVADLTVRKDALSSDAGRGLRAVQVANSISETGGVKAAADEADKAFSSGQLAEEAGALLPADGKLFAGMSERELLGVARMLRAVGDDVKTRNLVLERILREPAKLASGGKLRLDAKSYMRTKYAAMLSNPATHFRNILGNATLALYRPMELGFSGLARGDYELVREAKDLYSGLFRNALDSVTLAGRAIKAGEPVFDRSVGQEAYERSLAGTGSWLTDLVNVPSRLLMGADEGFKVLNYRSELWRMGMQDGRRLGKTGAELAAHAEDYVESGFNRSGGWVNPDAVEYARENAFQRGFEGGSVAAEVNSWNLRMDKEGSRLDGLDPLQFFIPFRRTPLNILLATAERVPGVGKHMARVQEDLAAGGIRAARAQAKLDAAMNLWVVFTGLAVSGNLSGSGPKNRDARKQLESTGWQPNSIKVGDTWYSYQTFEPFAGMLRIAANAADIQDALSRDDNAEDMGSVFGAFLGSAVKSTYDQSFMRGLSDLSGVLEGKAWSADRFVGSLVPVPSVVAAMNPDDEQRQVDGWLDGIFSKVPHFSENLDPQRNVFGTPLSRDSWQERTFSPIRSSEQSSTEEQQLVERLLEGTNGMKLYVPSNLARSRQIDLQDALRFAHKDNPKGAGIRSPYSYKLSLFGQPDALRTADAGLITSSESEYLPPIQAATRAMLDGDAVFLITNFGEDTARDLVRWTEADAAEDPIKVRRDAFEQLVKVYSTAADKATVRAFPKLKLELKRLDELKAATELQAEEMQSRAREKVDSFLDTGRSQ